MVCLSLHFGCSPNDTDLLLEHETVDIKLAPKERRADCDTLVFNCIDYRFAFANQEFLNDTLGLKDNYDHISIPGSIYNLVNPDTREIVFSKITSSVNFHLIKRVIIIAHKDCGGYGGSSAFGSKVAEEEYLSGDLRKAREMLIEKYPTLQVELYLEELTRENVHFEKIH